MRKEGKIHEVIIQKPEQETPGILRDSQRATVRGGEVISAEEARKVREAKEAEELAEAKLEATKLYDQDPEKKKDWIFSDIPERPKEDAFEEADLRAPSYWELRPMSDEHLGDEIEKYEKLFLDFRLMLHKKDPVEYDDIARNKRLSGESLYNQNILVKFRQKIDILKKELAERQAQKPQPAEDKKVSSSNGFVGNIFTKIRSWMK